MGAATAAPNPAHPPEPGTARGRQSSGVNIAQGKAASLALRASPVPAQESPGWMELPGAGAAIPAQLSWQRPWAPPAQLPQLFQLSYLWSASVGFGAKVQTLVTSGSQFSRKNILVAIGTAKCGWFWFTLTSNKLFLFFLITSFFYFMQTPTQNKSSRTKIFHLSTSFFSLSTSPFFFCFCLILISDWFYFVLQ